MRRLRVNRCSRHALHKSHQQYREKKKSDVVGNSLDFEPCVGQLVSQLRSRVAAAMVEGFVMLAPKEPIGRNCYYQQSAFPGHTQQLVERAEVVIDVLQHVQRGDDVESRSYKRKQTDVRPD